MARWLGWREERTGPVVETELLAPLVQISSGSQVDVMDTALVISAYQS